MTASPAPYQPPQRDQVIWRGDNDPPLVWQFGTEATPDILAGSEFELIVQFSDPAADLVLRTGDPGSTLTMNAAERTVTWAYTQAESAALPRGPASYALRREIEGKVRTWVYGTLAVKSGLYRD